LLFFLSVVARAPNGMVQPAPILSISDLSAWISFLDGLCSIFFRTLTMSESSFLQTMARAPWPGAGVKL
jgi:hypothetical protein